MKHHLFFLYTLLSIFTLFTGCTSQPSPSFKKGQRPYLFDHTQTTELLIVKADPHSGDSWSARVYQSGAQWEIRQGKNGENLIDRLANGGFINHLLDTLRTLQVDDRAAPAPESQYGLTPPKFALSWKTSTSTGILEYALQIGANFEVNNKDSGVFAFLDSSKTTYIVHGAALMMLSNLEHFNRLREERWVPQHPDDVDELELTLPKQPKLYAQRAGDQWSDAQDRPFRVEISPLLSALMHLRIERFVDSAEENEKYLKLFSQPLSTQVTLKDRAGSPTELHIIKTLAKGQTHWIGKTSLRPKATFQLYYKVDTIIKDLHLALRSKRSAQKGTLK